LRRDLFPPSTTPRIIRTIHHIQKKEEEGKKQLFLVKGASSSNEVIIGIFFGIAAASTLFGKRIQRDKSSP
jgi:hypothetical protein